MKKGIWALFTNPITPDQDQAFSRWYSEIHIPELLEVEGVAGASLHRIVGEGLHRYLALYELEGDDLEAVVGRVRARRADGGFRLTDTMQLEPAPLAVLYEAFEQQPDAASSD